MDLEPLIIHKEEEVPMKKYRKWVVCGDQHSPWHDKQYHRSVCEFLKDFQPDGFIINGDLMDITSLSRHLKGLLSLQDKKSKGIIKLKWEIEVANDMLDDFDQVLPKNCIKRYLEGNHEKRVSAWLEKDFNGVLEGMFSIEGALELTRRKYDYIPGYPNCFTKIGKLTVTHGQSSSLHTAKKHVDDMRRSVAFGHTHTSQMTYVGGLDILQVGVAVGHGADMQAQGLSYLKKNNRHVQGFLVVYEKVSNGTFWQYPVNAYEGHFFFGDKEY